MPSPVGLSNEEFVLIMRNKPTVLFLTGCHMARLRLINDDLVKAIHLNNFDIVLEVVANITYYIEGITDAINGVNENVKEHED